MQKVVSKRWSPRGPEPEGHFLEHFWDHLFEHFDGFGKSGNNIGAERTFWPQLVKMGQRVSEVVKKGPKRGPGGQILMYCIHYRPRHIYNIVAGRGTQLFHINTL